MTDTIMTEEEIRLMSAAYGDTERIRQGKLFDYQLEALEQLRAGLAYLNQKYPGSDPVILTFAPATKFSPSAQFLIQGEGEKNYTLTVEKKADAYVCEDDWYGLWLREAYDVYVEELLRDSGVTGRIYTNFTVPMGPEIGPDTTVSEFVAYSPRINRQTRIYLSAPEDLEAQANKLQALLKDAGMYGHYFVYGVPAEYYGDVDAMEQGRKNWESVSFNCYDV